MDPVPEGQPLKPVYFRYLTIVAFHTFLKQKVDAAVIECGIGGEYDSTNTLQNPIATGITSLGIDHIEVLGSTLPEIAWHKAGIMKSGVPAFTSKQAPEAITVLKSRAQEKGVELTEVDIHPEIANGKVKLGVEGEFQKINASLAIELAATFLRSRGLTTLSTSSLPQEFLQGLKDVKWGGRCETRKESNLTWHIDGAHTVESIQVAGEWFSSCIPTLNAITTSDQLESPRILLFNQQTRPAVPLLKRLYSTISESLKTSRPFTHVIFCSNITHVKSGYRPDLISINVDSAVVNALEVQRQIAKDWEAIAGNDAQIQIVPTIEEAVSKCRGIALEWQNKAGVSIDDSNIPRVLATGSIHLIGGVLEILADSEN
jgi:folylpolyglutamate synthase